jgi:threonine efflux protein
MLATLLTITALHWVVLVTPGVNLMLVSQLAASGQRRNALVASLGITAVTLTWALLALFGVSAVFAAHPQLRQTLQVAGGLYLCYVAVKLWRAGAPAEGMHTGKLGAWAAFRLGFFTNPSRRCSSAASLLPRSQPTPARACWPRRSRWST